MSDDTDFTMADVMALSGVSEASLDRELRKVRARAMLDAWAKAHAARDQVIRAAHAAGVSVHEIHRATGIARTTIMRILSD